MIIKVLVLLIIMSGTAFSGQSIKTSGPCSPIATNNIGSITINCPGISQQQGEQILGILNKILAEKLDFNAVMGKLDEILHQVNPNAPKTTYTFNGMKRIISPGRISMDDDGAVEIYKKMNQLELLNDWNKLLELSELQMIERPQWITPYAYAGKAYYMLDQKEKARELFEVAEKRIAGNPDYDPLQKPLSNYLKALRGF